MKLTKNSAVVKTVKKVLPAVVTVVCSKFLDSFQSSFDFFKEGYFKSPVKDNQKKKSVRIGGGSGFIVNKNGIIFTNRHVVEDPNAEYLVVLQNGEKLKPEVLAKDPLNDVAILKIEKNNLPVVKLGDSQKIELGEEVIAIGNALGLFQNTVSTGVISGLSRIITAMNNPIQAETTLRGLIQTDAAINPGNSGGPLVDINGKAIGINAAMVFGAENIGFALPINNAKRDLQELKEYGRIRQPFFGVRYICIDRELKDRFNLPVDFGALVIPEPNTLGMKNAVVPNSPAARAGIKEADIILEIADKKITMDKNISDILQEVEIGKELPLKVLRNNKEKTLKIILVERN